MHHFPSGPGLRGPCRGVLIDEGDPSDVVADRLFDQGLPGVLGGQPDEFELIRATQDVKGLSSDRAGGAEYQKTTGHSPKVRRAAASLLDPYAISRGRPQLPWLWLCVGGPDVVPDDGREQHRVEPVQRSTVRAEEPA